MVVANSACKPAEAQQVGRNEASRIRLQAEKRHAKDSLSARAGQASRMRMGVLSEAGEGVRTEERVPKWSADVEARSAASLESRRGATAWAVIFPSPLCSRTQLKRV